MSRYLLVSRSPEYEGRLRTLLGPRLASVPAERLALGTEAVLAATPRRPSVAVLGPVLTFEETRTLISGLETRYPGIGVLVVHERRGDLEDWVDAMDIHAVLTPEADDHTIEDVIGRLEQHSAPADAEVEPAAADVAPVGPAEGEASRVIAVAAPKGGQGKTTLAINLAAALADAQPNGVVLVDADLQFGDIANTLDVPLRHTLPELATHLDDELRLKTSLHSESGFFVVPGPADPAEGDRVAPTALAALLAALARLFRTVVVDTAPGLGEQTLAAIESSTDLVLLSALSVPSLRALRSELDTLEAIRLTPRRTIAVNFVDRVSGLRTADARRILGRPVDAEIPRSPAVLLSANRGEVLVRTSERDHASVAIRRLAATFDPAAAAPRDRVKGRRSA